MLSYFRIEDEIHADGFREFESFQGALNEVQRLAALPWDSEPVVAPCSSWRTCGRDFEIVEFHKTSPYPTEIARTPIAELRASGLKWSEGFSANP